MAYLDVSRITSWHAHVYFDAASRDAAREFREVVTAQFGNRVEMGRFHEREVGPHPRWSYEIAFEPAQFSDVVDARTERCTVSRDAPPRLQQCRFFSSASWHRRRAWRQQDRDR